MACGPDPGMTSALILAAGDGVRLGGQAKALIELGGVTLVERIAKLVRDFASQVIVGVREEDVTRVCEIIGSGFEVVAGGATRQQTAQYLVARARNQMILMHDVARPFASPDLFRSVLESASIYGGATPAVPVLPSDSIALSDGGWLGAPLPRDKVVLTQTPYAFVRQSIIEALRQAEERGYKETTITALLTQAGYPVHLVQGETTNIKITYPQDLVKAREIFAQKNA